MPRPFKCRRVGFIPGVTFFKPAGIHSRALEVVRLNLEEVEAIRLKDLEGLEQEEGAEKMNISRATFQRILVSARQKIADALLNGKAIRIEGGNFEVTSLRLRCIGGHQWEVPFGDVMVGGAPEFCPVCQAPIVGPCIPAGFGCHGRGRGWQRGRYRD